MKNFNLYIVAIGILLLSCINPTKHHYISFKSASEFNAFLNRKSGSFPLISAHRGGPMPGFPENAIETFDNATRYQPVVIEFDVAISKDSTLVIMHDDKLDRTTNGSGLVKDYTYADMQKLLLKDNDGQMTTFKIPTLEEVLIWGKDKVIFTVDVKRGVPFAKVVDMIKKTKSETNAIVITYNANQAAEVHRLAPDLMISASARSIADVERLNFMGIPNEKIVAFVGTAEPESAVYQYLHGKGITCILGTMGNLDKSAVANTNRNIYSELLAKGADIISTDELILAGKQFDGYRKDKKLNLAQLKIQ